jgi:hypothetical protein
LGDQRSRPSSSASPAVTHCRAIDALVPEIHLINHFVQDFLCAPFPLEILDRELLSLAGHHLPHQLGGGARQLLRNCQVSKIVDAHSSPSAFLLRLILLGGAMFSV